ncbi:MAG: hypothetical protein ACREH8_06800, partial [Opitutaceae bacterium]
IGLVFGCGISRGAKKVRCSNTGHHFSPSRPYRSYSLKKAWHFGCSSAALRSSAPFCKSSEMAEPMKRQGGGAIVDVSSISARITQPNRFRPARVLILISDPQR